MQGYPEGLRVYGLVYFDLAFEYQFLRIEIHFGKSDGIMTREEAKFVAFRSNFICLEKGHGSGTFGSTEAGIEAEAEAPTRAEVMQ